MYGIFTYIWLLFMVNAGKYTSPMDPMGKYISDNDEHFTQIILNMSLLNPQK